MVPGYTPRPVWGHLWDAVGLEIVGPLGQNPRGGTCDFLLFRCNFLFLWVGLCSGRGGGRRLYSPGSIFLALKKEGSGQAEGLPELQAGPLQRRAPKMQSWDLGVCRFWVRLLPGF